MRCDTSGELTPTRVNCPGALGVGHAAVDRQCAVDQYIFDALNALPGILVSGHVP
jgi:hypothetical protein